MLPSKSPKKQTLTPKEQADAARFRGAVDRMYGQQSPTPQVMAGVRDAVRNVTTQQPTTRPPGKGTTGGPLVKPPPPGMGGLGQAMSNLGIKKGAGSMVGQKFGGMKKGGKVSSASKRADGIASKGKTKGRMI